MVAGQIALGVRSDSKNVLSNGGLYIFGEINGTI